MNPSFSSDWSREEKEEYATKRMNEMKLKNEQFKQRHAEVEKDRLEAEKKCSAVTSVAKVLPKTPDNIEEKPTFHREPRKQREWDIGKSTNDGDWYPSAQQDYPSQEYHDSRTWHNESDRYPNTQQDYHRSQDYHHSRPPRRGGFYDKRRERQDSTWRSRGSGPVPSRGSSRYRGSNQGRSTAFQSGNASNYSRESNKNNFKTSTDSSFKTSSNWNDSKRNSYYSNNAYPKLAVKSESDKMWHDDGLNEVQNKQSRVEKWVKSINKVEDWGEGDEKPCKNYKSVGTGRNSGNYQDREQKSWHNEGHIEPSTKKYSTQNKSKYEKQYEHSFNKNVSTYGDKIPHASDLDHHALAGKKTNYGHKRDNKMKYNHGVSSYHKMETSNLKNDPKIRKQSHCSKDSGADIWDYGNEDEPNNKISDSRTEFHGSKHALPDKNRDSRSAACGYKEADNFDSKTRSEFRKKEYSRRKDTESDIWNDCDQTNDWDIKLDTTSGSEAKEQSGESTNVNWDCNYGGDDWNNKVVDSEIESNVKTHNSEYVGWDHEKKDDLKDDSKTEEPADCDMNNDFANDLVDEEVLTSEKNDHDENKDYEKENIYDDTKETVQGLEYNLEHSTSDYKTNDFNEMNYHDSGDSEFTSNLEIDNSKKESTVPEVKFIEHDYDDSTKYDSAEQNLQMSKYSDDELDDSKAKVEEQKCDCNTDSNEPGFNILDHENMDKIKGGNDSKYQLIMVEETPSLSINEDTSGLKTTLSDSQAGVSEDNSTALNQSLSNESNEMDNQNHNCFEMDKIAIKDETNISCVTNELSNNSVITHSKLNESDELLQQSICNVENQDSQFFSEDQDKSISSFSEISSENVSCDIINKSSPVLSQESVQDDDPSSHTNVDVTESTKR